MKIGFQVKIGGESAKYTLPPPSQSQRFKFLQQVVDALPDLRIALTQIFHVLGVEISGAVAAAEGWEENQTVPGDPLPGE